MRDRTAQVTTGLLACRTTLKDASVAAALRDSIFGVTQTSPARYGSKTHNRSCQRKTSIRCSAVSTLYNKRKRDRTAQVKQNGTICFYSGC